MRWRIVFGSVSASLGLLVGIMALPPTTRAASSAGSQATFSAPHIVKKVILTETSIDGPSVWNPNFVSGVPGDGTGIIIAWTGTDSAHRLNSVRTYNGSSFFSKKIYNESSQFRPAVTSTGENSVILAWTGTDANHSLNVLATGVFSTPLKLTLWNESSFTAPAIAAIGGKLYLAWTGTDANHSLNVLPINVSASGLKPGAKTILRQFSSIARPSLAPNIVAPNTVSGLLMSWVATSPVNRLRFATSADGINWTQPSSSPLAEWSGSGPSMLALGITNFPHDFLAWTGTDASHSVNVRYTESFPAWPLANAKTTFGEQALGGPSIANASSISDESVRQIVLAWTGTDTLHRLNVAFVGV
jgi:hypothetical protein